jgi:hypothetical protein
MSDQNPLLIGKPIRGWLLALIIALGFLGPAAALNDYTEMQKVLSESAGKAAVRGVVVYAHALLLFAYAGFSMYTANILWQKNSGAVASAKTNLISLAMLSVAADICALLVFDLPAGARAHVWVAALSRIPRALLVYGIPYLYLKRSWRVRDTYALDLPVGPAEVAASPAVAPPPASDPPASDNITEDLSIPCPLCGQPLRVSTLKQGENYCSHCSEKFMAE